MFGAQNFDASLDLSSLDGNNGFRLDGIAADDRSGHSVSGAGDINGDGIDDLIIGAYWADPNGVDQAGESYVVFGAQNFGASFDLSSLDGTNGFRLAGTNLYDISAFSVSGAGDVNGDGIDDLIIGAPGAGPDGISGAGESYVIFGWDFTGAITQFGTTGNDTLTGTDAAETLIGNLGDDTLQGNGGPDILRAGGGDDRIEISDASFIKVDGGGGQDTLALSGALNLDLTTLANLSIESIEVIDLNSTSANTLTLDPEDVFDLSETGSSEASAALGTPTASTLVVRGSTGDTVNLKALPSNHPNASGFWHGSSVGVAIGTDWFDAYAFDDGTGHPLATVFIQQTIAVAGGNHAPVAVPDSNTAVGDALVEAGTSANNVPVPGDPLATGNVLSNDTDLDTGETKIVVGVQAGMVTGPLTDGVDTEIPGTYGTLVLAADGTFTYTLDNTDPDTDALVQDDAASDVFTYTMADGKGATSSTTLTINVTGTNDAPVIEGADGSDDVLASGQSVTLAITLDGPAGVGGVTVTLVDSGGLFTVPAFVTVPEGTQTIEFVATAGGTYGTTTIDALVDDVEVASFDLTIGDPANDLIFSGQEDTTLSGQLIASDVDGDTANFTLASGPSDGTLTLNADGSFDYTPDANFNGTDKFSVVASDGNGGADTATVNVTVAPINDAPVIEGADGSDDVLASGQSVTLAITLDAPAGVGGVTVTLVDSGGLFTVPAFVTVPEGTQTIEFVATAGGTYGTTTINALVGDVEVASFDLTIGDPANDLIFSGQEDTTISGAVIASDVDGDALSFALVSGPAEGTLALDTDGSFDYTPDPNFDGTDEFSVVVSDGNGGTDSVTVNINVAPVNDTPVAVADSNAAITSPLIYFSADDGTHGQELYLHNVATGDTTLIDLNVSGGSSPSGFTALDAKIYFAADDGGLAGQELWVHDPVTGASTLVADLNSIPFSGSFPSEFTVLDGKLYFTADDGNRELYVYDPASGTATLINSYLSSSPSELTVADGKLYFTADDGNRELYVYDPVTDSTASSITDLNGFDPRDLTVVDNTIYFSAFSTARELWAYDTADAYTYRATFFGSDGFLGNTVPQDPDVSELTPLDGNLYFVASFIDDGIIGREIWVYIPGSEGALTKRVTFLDSSVYPAIPTDLTVIDGKLYFVALDSDVDDPTAWHSAIYVYDAATDTTTLVAADLDASGSVSPSDLTVLDGKLYFTADDGTSGRELYVHDPATGDTTLVDINAFGSSDPRELTAIAGKLYFSADDGISGREFYVYDPVTGTTTIVDDLAPGSASSTPTELTGITLTLGDAVVEAGTSANDVPAPGDPLATGNVLTNDTDPDSGDTKIVVSVQAGTTISDAGTPIIGTYGTLLLAADGTFAYTLDNADPDTNALAQGEAASDVFTYTMADGQGATSSTTLTINITGTNDAPVLAGIEGAALVYSENDPATTIADTLAVSDVDDANIGSATVTITSGFVSGEDVLDFTDQNGIVGSYDADTGVLTMIGSATLADYETALRSVSYANTSDDPSIVTRTLTLIVNDGDADSNTVIRDITVTPVNDTPVAVADSNAAITSPLIYFSADDGTHGQELYLHNVATGDTTLIDLNVSGGSSPSGFTALDAKIYFAADDGGLAGQELWVHDPVTGASTLVADLNSIPFSGSFPSEFTVLDGKLYFTADDGNRELYVYDPASGTATLINSYLSSSPSELTVADGKLYFTADDGNRELYVYDPVTDSTASSITDLNGFDPRDLTVVDNTIYFSAFSTARELWAYDTADAYTYRATFFGSDGFLGNTVPQDPDVSELTPLDGNLYFVASFIDDGIIGREIWVYIPGSEGALTKRVTFLDSSVYPAIPTDLTVIDGKLYFVALDSDVDDPTAWHSAIYVYDAATDTTTLVAADLDASGSVSPSDLTVLDGKLYFTADDGTSGRELYVHDPATGDTTLVDINAFGSSDPRELTAIAGKLYFSADDGISGREFYVYDPVTGTTTIVDDLAPGSASSTPTELTGITLTLGDAVVEAGTSANDVPAPGDPLATGNVLTNDTDPNSGDTKIVVSVQAGTTISDAGTPIIGTYGTLLLAADGTFAYTLDNADPDTNALAQGEAASDVFTYTMADGQGATSSTTLTINITGTNDAPVAADDAYVIDEDQTLILAAGVLSNDTDVEGDALTAVLASGPTNGALTLNADGSFTYTPEADFNGTDSFTYTAYDGGLDSNTATVTITVAPINDAPVAVADTIATTPTARSLLYFSADDGGDAGRELYVYDVGGDGVSLVADLNEFGDSGPFDLTAFDDKLYFGALGNDAIDGAFGRELYVLYPGVGIPTLVDIVPGPNSSDPGKFTLFDGEVYFVGGADGELYVYDPVSGDSSRVDNSISRPLFADELTGLDGKLYMVADSGVSDRELWYHDFLSGRTDLIDISTIGVDFQLKSSSPSELTVFGGKLYFAADYETISNAFGRELLVLDPTDNSFGLVADINVGEGSSQPRELTVFDGKLYFIAKYTDVANAPAVRLYVLNPDGSPSPVQGAEGVGLSDLTPLGDKLYFIRASQIGTEIYVHDPVTGAASSIPDTPLPSDLTAFDGKLYFTADDGVIGRELYVYDPLSEAPALVADLNAFGGSDPSDLTAFDGKLYFTADDGVSGRELYVYDPIADTAKRVEDLAPGSLSSNPTQLTGLTAVVLGDDVVEAGVSPDGTPFPGDPLATGNVLTNDTDADLGDTKIVVSVQAGTTISDAGTPIIGTYGMLLLAADGTFTYTLDNADPDTNALAQGEAVSDIFTYTMADAAGVTSDTTLTINISGANDAPVLAGIEGAALAYSERDPATAITNALVIEDVDDTQINSATIAITAGYVSSEDVLGFTDQSGITGSYDVGAGVLTLTGVASLSDYETALQSVTYQNTSFAPSVNVRTVSFTVNDGQINSDLVTRNVTVSAVNDAPAAVADINAAITSNLLYFSADDGGDAGRELYVYDVGGDGVSLVADLNEFGDSGPFDLTAFDDKLYFGALGNDAIDGAFGRELYVLYPGVGIPTLVDIVPGPNSSDPGKFTLFDGEVYFVGGADGELYVYDPVSGDSSRVDDSISRPLFADELTGLDGKLYMVADSGVSDRELWYHDFLSGRTDLIDISTIGVDFQLKSSSPSELTVFGGKLYFAADYETISNAFGRELLVLDPTDNSFGLVADINVGEGSSQPRELTVFDGKLYFIAKYTDVANAPAVRLYVLNPDGSPSPVQGAEGVGLSDLTPLGDKLYFIRASQIGTEIYVHDPVTGAASSIPDTPLPSDLTAFDGKLYFTADDGVIGRELYVYDPLSEAPALVADLNAFGGSDPSDLTAFDGKLYFTADDGVSGRELYVYDPIADTAKRVEDLAPGSLSSNPTQLTGLTAVVLGDDVVEAGVSPDGTPFPGDPLATGNVLTNDTDADLGDTKIVVSVQAGTTISDAGTPIIGTYGMLLLAADGTFTYTLDNADPDTNALAQGEAVSDIFTYTMADGEGTTSSTTLTINITGTNDAPTGSPTPDLPPGFEDQSYTVSVGQLVEDFGDAEGDTLSVANLTASDGTVTDNGDGTYTITPAADFNGIMTLTYDVTDGNGGSLTNQAQTYTLVPVDDAPRAADDAYLADEDVALSVAATGVLSNDNAVDGDALTVTEVNGQAADIGAQIALATGALLTLSADGNFEYDPNGAFEALAVGETATDSFNYTVSDSNGGTDTAAVEITINGANDMPEVAGADLTVDENQTTAGLITATDQDASDALTFRVSGGADAGQFTIDANTGELSFSVAPNYEMPTDADGNGVYEAQVEVRDGHGGVAMAPVSVTVQNVNDPPMLHTAALTIDENKIIAGIVLADDQDLPSDTVTFSLTGGGADDGQFTINATTGALNFLTAPDFETTHDANSDGIYEAEIRVDDDNGGITTGTVEITVRDVLDDGKFNLAGLDGTNGFKLYGINAGDFSGFSVSAAGDFNGDGISDVIIGARGADRGSLASVGQSYVVFGGIEKLQALDADGDGIINLENLDGTNGFIVDGVFANENSGRSVSSAGDVNGDGFSDLIIGAPDGNSGRSYVVFGGENVAPLGTLALSSVHGSSGFVVPGDGGDNIGISVSDAGDINGDGFDDLIIGAPAANGAFGESYVVFGGQDPAGSGLTNLDGTNGFKLVDTALNNPSSFSLSVSGAGDIDGDGISDLIIGAPAANRESLSLVGQSYVVFGGQDFGASFDLASLDGVKGFRLDGIAAFDNSGDSVSGAGDINGDGFDDLIIGAPHANGYAGDSYVVFGGLANLQTLDSNGDGLINLQNLNGANGFHIDGITTWDRSGTSVSSAGDINGDGFDDLMIGAPGGNGNPGETYVVFGSQHVAPSGTFDLTSLDGSNGFRLDAIDAFNGSGTSVSGAGDINNDGFDDIIIGAPGSDPNGNVQAGQSYVVFGGSFGEDTTPVTATGTGGGEMLIGGAGSDALTGNGGADVIRSGAGNDVLGISDTGFARIDGGTGTDTLRLDGSGITLDLSGISNETITGIEAIDLTGTGNNAVTLTVADVYKLSDTPNEDFVDANSQNNLVISGDTGDTATLETPQSDEPGGGGAWTDGGQTTIDTDTYNVKDFVHDQDVLASVAIHSDITII